MKYSFITQVLRKWRFTIETRIETVRQKISLTNRYFVQDIF